MARSWAWTPAVSGRGSSRLESGDRQAEFDHLARRSYGQAYRVAYRMTGNRADAEDLTQETFLRAYRFFGNYHPGGSFAGWLYRIMCHLFVDSLRRRPQETMLSLDQPLGGRGGREGAVPEIPDVEADPEHMVLSQVWDEHIQCALSSLSWDFRVTVILADVEGLSYEEIGVALGCSRGTVCSRLHRGRKMLRARIMISQRKSGGNICAPPLV